jgi:ribose-phosphate pyrophosphokinase
MTPDELILFDSSCAGYPVTMAQYPDSMPLVAPLYADPKAALLRPKSFAAFMAAMFWFDALAERGAAMPRLVLPNIPGARQDRLNSTGDYLFTAKSIARELNARGFPRVDVLDPHSDVAPALIDRCRVHHASVLRHHECEYTGVISPDAGAEKRAYRIAQELCVPLYHAWKNRDVATGKLTGFGCQPLERGHYLVADDLCDGGGTFLGLAAVIESYGATADLYVTHGLFTQGTTKLLNAFNLVACTDSTLGEKPGVQVIPRCIDILKHY